VHDWDGGNAMRQEFNSRGQRGFSLLEQAAVFPILLLIIAGAVDINTLLQSYSALKEGVNASLRCVYTTDGKCVSSAPDTRPRLYNYYRINRHEQYLVDTFDFRGNYSWINRPTYNFSNFRAEVLGSVEYDLQTADIFAARVYFPAERLANYTLRTATLPYITGSARNPTTQFRGISGGPNAAPAGAYPFTSFPASSVDLVSDESRGDPEDLTATAEFIMPPAPSNVFNSHSLENPSAGHIANFGNDVTAAQTDAALHITGDKGNTSTGSSGGVSIRLQKYNSSQRHWTAVESLGAQQLGRLPGEASPANFVIRGLPNDFIDRSVPEYDELHSYSPLRLEYGARYRIVFSLHRDSGRVGWQAHQIKLFLPVDEARQEVLQCSGGMTPCSAPSTCRIVGASPPESVFSGPPTIHTSAAPIRVESPISIASCSTGEAGIASLLASAGVQACPAAFQIRTEIGSCSVQHLQSSCPLPSEVSPNSENFGVAETPGSDGRIHSSSSAHAICPPPANAISEAPQNVRWTVRSVPVPASHIGGDSSGTLSVAKESCTSAVGWPQGSLLYNYPHLSFTQNIQGTDRYYTGNEDPAGMLADPNSGFACSDFTLGSAVVDVTQSTRTPENETSLFFGNHPLPGCDWRAALREDAIRFGLSSDSAYFVAEAPSQTGTNDIWDSSPEACVDPNPEIMWSAPDSKTLVPGGPFAEGRLPADCGGAACAAEFVGFAPGTTGSTTYNFAYAAEHFGFNEIQTYYPRARWNCSEKDCVELSVSEDGESVNSLGSIKVPLYVLGRGIVELRYQGTARKELNYSR
jgi:hypothetical protein